MRAPVLPFDNKSAIPIGNLPFGTDSYPSGVPHQIQDKGLSAPTLAYVNALQDRRRARFLSWVHSVGGQKGAIEKLDKGQAQISQLMTGKKPIGETLARDLEYRAKLPFGWLDEEDAVAKKNNSIPQDALTKRLLTTWSQLPPDDRRELAGMAAGLLRRRPDAA
jgi:hypothetical protein